MLGMKIENELVMIIGASFVAWGILYLISAMAGYGKSDKEKKEIENDIFNQFTDGMGKRARYDNQKRILNDQFNKDIQKNIEEAIKKSKK